MGCASSTQTVQHHIHPPLDQYHRQELIGVGHHARVYRCKHPLNQQQYALKVIDQLHNQHQSTKDQEAYTAIMAVLKNIKDQRIVEYIHSELQGNQLSLVMPIAKQGTLKKYLKKEGKLTEQVVATFTQEIIEGLIVLHNQGLFHKDLKPQNILIQNEHLQLTDFAIAQIYDDRLSVKVDPRSKENKFYRGDSVPYMAPEVIIGSGWTEKADVWSLGTVVIEMLTGKIPWSDISTTFQEVLNIIRKSTYPSIPPEISKQCQDFLRCCLAVNPVKRSNLTQLYNHDFLKHCPKKDVIVKEETVVKQHKSINKQKKNNNENLSSSQLRIRSNEKANRVVSPKHQFLSVEKTPKSPVHAISQRYVPDQNTSIGPLSQRNIYKPQKSRQIYPKTNKEIIFQSKGKNPGLDYSTLSKEDILPQINEDQQETNVVLLNNKKKKMEFAGKPIRTQPTQMDTSLDKSGIRPRKNSIKIEEEDWQGMGRKMGTEPNLISSTESKDYFKRPLKLLKKKIQQRKMNQSSNYSSSFSKNQSSLLELEYKQDKIKANKQKRQSTSKIRSNTESSREELVIDTQFARAERDRYHNQQQVMRKQRQKEKVEWEEQLKKQAELLRKELSRRYAYPYPNIPM